MFENIGHFFKRMVKEPQKELGSKDAAKERLHIVLMQDRANVSADFLELMKQEIIDVIEKYIVVDEEAIDVRLSNQTNEDGTNGVPILYANIPIVNIKNEMMAEKIKDFEGVDFNKEMNIPNKKDNKKQDNKSQETVAEVKEVKVEENNNPKNEIDNDKDSKEEENEVFEEVDDAEDDDDDVTFDDLLKAAEEADKKEAEKGKEETEKTSKHKKKK